MRRAIHTWKRGARKVAILTAAVVVAAVCNAHGQTVASWIAPGGGNWTDAANWSTNPFFPNNGSPVGTLYNAVISNTGTVGNGISLSGTVTLSGLTLSAANTQLNLVGSGTTLQFASGGTLNLQAGTLWLADDGMLKGGMLNVSPGATAILRHGILDAVTLIGSAGAVQGTPSLIRNGLTLANGTFSTGQWTRFQGDSPQTVSGTGDIVMGFNSLLDSEFGTPTITFGPGIIIRGGGDFGDVDSKFVVQGTLLANDGNQTLEVRMDGPGSFFTNAGTVKAWQGGDIHIRDWVKVSNFNAGVLTGGNWVVDSTGTSSEIFFDVGTITTNAATVELVGANSQFGAFDSMTQNNGTFRLSGGRQFNVSLPFQNSGTVVLGTGGTLRLNNAANSLTNPGTVVVNGGTLDLGAGVLSNSGSIAVDHGTIVVRGTVPSGYGSLTVTAGTVQIGRTMTPAQMRLVPATASMIDIIVGGTLDNTGETLVLDAATNLVRLSGGTISGGTIRANGAAVALSAVGSFSTLNATILQTNLSVFSSATLSLNAIDLGGRSATIGNGTIGGALLSSGTLGGSSGATTISFVGTGSSNLVGSSTTALDILANTVVRADGSNGTVGASSISLVNHGALVAANAGTLTISGNWTNLGSISVTNATVNLGGTFAPSSVGQFVRSGGTVNISGTVANASSVLALDGNTGSWRLSAGRINGGSVTTTGGSALLAAGAGTLDAVNLSGLLDILSNATVTFQNGLTLNDASIRLNGRATFRSGVTQTLAGNGTVLFTGAGVGSFNQFVVSAGTLTLGSGITLQTNGESGTLGIAGTLVNQGLLSSQTAAKGISISGTFANQGSVVVRNGGTFSVNVPQLTNYATGGLNGGSWSAFGGSTISFGTSTITTNNATILLDGVGSTFAAVNSLSNNLGAFTITNGRNLTTSGSLTNGGTVVVGPGSSLKIVTALNNPGTVDLNNALIVDYTGTSPLNDLASQIGTHIVSSSADAAHRIGYAEASVLGVGSFAGQTVDSTSAILQLSFAGDSNLDGKVDVTDLGSLATHWQSSADWFGGDFNYDGFVDVSDLGLLATNWQAGVSGGSPPGAASLTQALTSVGLGGTNIPEPVGLPTLLLLAGPLIHRRRRH
jgi:hypothetical protein